MYASLADKSTRKLLNQLTSFDLLLIDELGYLNLRPKQANIFFRLMDERYPQKTTIITTNMEFTECGDFLHNKRMAQALIDRLLHKCHVIRIEGPSLRAAVKHSAKVTAMKYQGAKGDAKNPVKREPIARASKTEILIQ